MVGELVGGRQCSYLYATDPLSRPCHDCNLPDRLDRHGRVCHIRRVRSIAQKERPRHSYTVHFRIRHGHWSGSLRDVIIYFYFIAWISDVNRLAVINAGVVLAIGCQLWCLGILQRPLLCFDTLGAATFTILGL